jgi:GGDEF domain-containing protein
MFQSSRMTSVLVTDPALPAATVVERLRSALAPRTEVSIGAATFGRDGTDFLTLYGCADAALYEQKAARRARASAAPAPVVPTGRS